jgi:hypothetical protein
MKDVSRGFSPSPIFEYRLSRQLDVVLSLVGPLHMLFVLVFGEEEGA